MCPPVAPRFPARAASCDKLRLAGRGVTRLACRVFRSALGAFRSRRRARRMGLCAEIAYAANSGSVRGTLYLFFPLFARIPTRELPALWFHVWSVESRRGQRARGGPRPPRGGGTLAHRAWRLSALRSPPWRPPRGGAHRVAHGRRCHLHTGQFARLLGGGCSPPVPPGGPRSAPCCGPDVAGRRQVVAFHLCALRPQGTGAPGAPRLLASLCFADAHFLAAPHEPQRGPEGWSCGRCGRRMAHGRRGALRRLVPQAWAGRAETAARGGARSRSCCRARGRAARGFCVLRPGLALCIRWGRSAPSARTLERHPCAPRGPVACGGAPFPRCARACAVGCSKRSPTAGARARGFLGALRRRGPARHPPPRLRRPGQAV